MGRSPSKPDSPTTEAARRSARFRPNVCAVLVGDLPDRVLVFHRADGVLGDATWQFPQGGIHPEESPREALLRELKEEIGTNRVEVLAQAPEPIRYVYPPDVAERLAQGDPAKRGYAGQEQTWFLAKLLERDAVIRFEGPAPEFDRFRWVSPAEALKLVVPFKAEAYRLGLTALGLVAEESAK